KRERFQMDAITSSTLFIGSAGEPNRFPNSPLTRAESAAETGTIPKRRSAAHAPRRTASLCSLPAPTVLHSGIGPARRPRIREPISRRKWARDTDRAHRRRDPSQEYL